MCDFDLVEAVTLFSLSLTIFGVSWMVIGLIFQAIFGAKND